MGQIISRIQNYFRSGSASASTVTIDIHNRRRLSSKGDLEPPRVYSWTNRRNINCEDFKYVALDGKTLVKQPGTIQGQQFIIEGCRNCTIFLLDWSDSVTILDCTGCAILIGPCKGSFFLRHCVDCTVLVVCQQFRTRDCRRISAYICCTTQPIIENTIGAKFACLQLSYPKLEEHFRSAGLSPFDNNWSNIHDYTPNGGDSTAATGGNYFLVDDPLASANVGINDPDTIEGLELAVNFNPTDSLIPFTHGRFDEKDQSSMVVLYQDSSSISTVRDFLQKIQRDFPKLKLIKTKAIRLSPADSRRLLNTDAFADAASKGYAIVLHLCGQNAIMDAQNAVACASTFSPGAVYVSTSTEIARSQIETVWNLAEMEMN